MFKTNHRSQKKRGTGTSQTPDIHPGVQLTNDDRWKNPPWMKSMILSYLKLWFSSQTLFSSGEYYIPNTRKTHWKNRHGPAPFGHGKGTTHLHRMDHIAGWVQVLSCWPWLTRLLGYHQDIAEILVASGASGREQFVFFEFIAGSAYYINNFYVFWTGFDVSCQENNT